MSDSPETHPFISEKEKTYIQLTRSKALDGNKNQKTSRPPYLAIAKSVPVLAYLFVFSCFMWTMSVSVVYIPIYLSTVHGFNAEMTGILFSVIACTRLTGAFTWTFAGNLLTNSGLLSQQVTRKTCICVGE
ncbi:sodium-dependent phosphate transport protein 1 [Elysia marginata]|uniref:Sodium-dependent phosphate transport protein 1 n=1 Tax=Elysia marginata TaxID=1093978 RepID=A0AAV4JL30_9GAST|nr:sodium-dependent phosphate transport protein 1 [Elysia marginata]